MNYTTLQILIKDALVATDLYSDSLAELLVIGAVAQTKGGAFLQHDESIGIWLCTREDFNEVKDSYLSRNVGLVYKMLQKLHLQTLPYFEAVKYSLLYAAMIEAASYMQLPESLPGATDTKALITFYKKYTPTGISEDALLVEYKKYVKV